MPSLDEILRILGPGASPALVLFIVLLYRQEIVLGWMYKQMVTDRDYWRDLAEKGLRAAETSTHVTETLAAKHLKG